MFCLYKDETEPPVALKKGYCSSPNYVCEGLGSSNGEKRPPSVLQKKSHSSAGPSFWWLCTEMAWDTQGYLSQVPIHWGHFIRAMQHVCSWTQKGVGSWTQFPAPSLLLCTHLSLLISTGWSIWREFVTELILPWCNKTIKVCFVLSSCVIRHCYWGSALVLSIGVPNFPFSEHRDECRAQEQWIYCLCTQTEAVQKQDEALTAMG